MIPTRYCAATGKAFGGRSIPWTVVLALLILPASMNAQKFKQRMAETAAEVFDYPKMAAIYQDITASGKATPDDWRRLALA